MKVMPRRQGAPAAWSSVIAAWNRVTFLGVTPALVLRLIVRGFLCFPGLVAHLHRVIAGDPVEAAPVGIPEFPFVGIHIAAVVEPLVLLCLLGPQAMYWSQQSWPQMEPFSPASQMPLPQTEPPTLAEVTEGHDVHCQLAV